MTVMVTKPTMYITAFEGPKVHLAMSRRRVNPPMIARAASTGSRNFMVVIKLLPVPPEDDRDGVGWGWG